jgi:hypothetical protein
VHASKKAELPEHPVPPGPHDFAHVGGAAPASDLHPGSPPGPRHWRQSDDAVPALIAAPTHEASAFPHSTRHGPVPQKSAVPTHDSALEQVNAHEVELTHEMLLLLHADGAVHAIRHAIPGGHVIVLAHVGPGHAITHVVPAQLLQTAGHVNEASTFASASLDAPV